MRRPSPAELLRVTLGDMESFKKIIWLGITPQMCLTFILS